MFDLVMTIIWGFLMCANGIFLCEVVLHNRKTEKGIRIFWFVLSAFWFVFETLKLGGFII